MKILLTFLFTSNVALCFVSPSSALAQNEPDCSIASSAMETASRIRGLKLKQAVPCKLQNRDQVERYLQDAIKKKVPEKKLKGEERIYKLIGLIPLDYDYTNGLIKLYTDQLGGYYDPEKKYYAMAAWMPTAFQMPIAVHELTHALQDQHFDLEKLIDEKENPGDALMARLALVEGDATAVMLDYARELQGGSPVSQDEDVSAFMLQNLAGSMLSPGLSSAPPALQALLIYPYVSGLNFVHSILRDEGYKGVNKLFQNPPRSTEEILHPQKYGAEEKDFRDVPVGQTEFSAAIKEPEYSDRLGEFVIATLLGSWIGPSAASASAGGWAGDRIALFNREGSDLGYVAWWTSWDTTKDAEEFDAAITKAYEKRFLSTALKEGATQKDVSVSVFSVKDVGKVRISRKLKDVTIEIGLP